MSPLDVYGVWVDGKIAMVGTPSQIRRKFPGLTDEEIQERSEDGCDDVILTKLLTEDGNRRPNMWRDLVACEMRDAGATYSRIAEVLRITVAMAQSGVTRVRSGRYKEADWTLGNGSGWSPE